MIQIIRFNTLYNIHFTLIIQQRKTIIKNRLLYLYFLLKLKLFFLLAYMDKNTISIIDIDFSFIILKLMSIVKFVIIKIEIFIYLKIDILKNCYIFFSKIII